MPGMSSVYLADRSYTVSSYQRPTNGFIPTRRHRAPAPPRASNVAQPSSAAAAPGIDIANVDEHDLRGTIVVTGAGPAGLAAAAALHRAGLPVLVLERRSELAPGGSALGLWTNAWRALDALSAGDALRAQHPQVEE
jgi:hypothetical protein